MMRRAMVGPRRQGTCRLPCHSWDPTVRLFSPCLRRRALHLQMRVDEEPLLDRGLAGTQAHQCGDYGVRRTLFHEQPE